MAINKADYVNPESGAVMASDELITDLIGGINDNETAIAGFVDSGTNPNGSYIRFSDGTQICWGSVAVSQTPVAWGSVFGTGSITFTFASSFVETPSCTLSYLPSTGGTAWETVSSIGTTVGHGYLTRPIAGLITGRLHYTAIGRWK